jgi:hypothetical protein
VTPAQTATRTDRLKCADSARSRYGSHSNQAARLDSPLARGSCFEVGSGATAPPSSTWLVFQRHQADSGWRGGILIDGVEDARRAFRAVHGRTDHEADLVDEADSVRAATRPSNRRKERRCGLTSRAQPLVSYRVIFELISATTTKTVLTVRCELDTAQYPSGIVVSDAEMAAEFHGEWNYTISPNTNPPNLRVYFLTSP